MRISDWSSDVCSSDLLAEDGVEHEGRHRGAADADRAGLVVDGAREGDAELRSLQAAVADGQHAVLLAERHLAALEQDALLGIQHRRQAGRSEEHTSELQSLMRISYAVFCLQKKHTP